MVGGAGCGIKVGAMKRERGRRGKWGKMKGRVGAAMDNKEGVGCKTEGGGSKRERRMRGKKGTEEEG